MIYLTYLTIPLSLIFGSVLAIGCIIWRKAPYIKKLSAANLPAQAGLPKNFWFRLFSEFAPELRETSQKLKFHEYKDTWLIELEKFLRRLRLLSLRIDRLSDSLINKIRRGYQNGNGNSAASNTVEKKSSVIQKTEQKPIINNLELFKKEEQRLIIEIAKNPKDSKLYDTLGDMYVKMGEYGDAKESFEAAIELDSNNGELKKKLSIILEKLNLSKTSQN